MDNCLRIKHRALVYLKTWELASLCLLDSVLLIILRKTCGQVFHLWYHRYQDSMQYGSELLTV